MLNIIVVVAALGYFVDIYDLLLFAIVRVKSLNSLGIVNSEEVLSQGVYLLNSQMTGMLIGGLLWGILGDKKGRVSVLFGSILLYSIANILNGFVTSIETYGWLRLIAGIGLAGELGAGITLVSETMSKEDRGYGTMIVVSFGVLGAVLAGIIGQNFEWRTAYFIGGGLGLLLLVLRIGVYESGMYESVKKSNISKGNFFKLFKSGKIFLKYLSCIAIGLPIWFLIGILVTLSPEISMQLNIKGVVAGTAIMCCYIGLSVGDVIAGFLSQVFKTRKKIVLLYLIATVIIVPTYLYSNNVSLVVFYFLCGMIGVAGGYWALFVTMAAEQFGTNIRSTVATTVPNFVRGALVPLSGGLLYLRVQLGYSLTTSALIVGGVSLVIAFIALWYLDETYGKDLDYFEVS